MEEVEGDLEVTLYTREAAAQTMGVAVRTVDRLVATHKLAATYIGRCVRIQEKDLLAFLEGAREKTDEEIRGVALAKK